MKEIASSIIILSAVLLLISAEHFDNLLFWVLGIVMLIDGTILLVAFRPFSNWMESIHTNKPS